MVKNLNVFLEGFRTVLLMWVSWALMYVDVFVSNLSGFTPEMLKGAAVMAAITTVKQVKTDVIPKIQLWLEQMK